MTEDADMSEYHNGSGQNGFAFDVETDDDRKIFIGGLHPDCKEPQIREHFSKFGEIEKINLKIDQVTYRSRGFGFVVFADKDAFEKACACSEHVIMGKSIEPRKAKARQGKVFVGGLKSEMTDDEIKEHFSQFGEIAQAEMPYDKIKSQRKPFCFITYKTDAVVKKLLTEKGLKHIINGEELEVKKATPKDPMMMAMRGGMRGGGFGGRGGARGGGPRGGRGGRGGGGGGGWGGPGGGGGWGGDSYGGGYGDGYGYGGGYGGYDDYGYSGYGGYGGGGYGDYSGYGGYGSGGYGGGGSGYGGSVGKQRGRGTRHQPY